MNFSPNVFSIYYNCYSLLLIVFLSKILTMPHLTEELTKELITKAEFYGEIRLIKQEIEASVYLLGLKVGRYKDKAV